jgi:tetratricopeptide (TPR) repeat protein
VRLATLRLSFGLFISSLLIAHCAGQAFASIAEADQLLLEDKYRQAEDAYRGLLPDDQTGDVSAGLAVALAKQKWPAKVQEAEHVLKDAREKYSDNPNVIAAGGYVSFIHSGTVASPAKRDLYLEASESLCKRAIKSDPNIVIAQQTLGLVKMAEDEVDEAIDPLRKAAEMAEGPVNLTLLSQALLRLNPKSEEAESLVNKAISMKDDYYPAHIQKAIVLLHRGKSEEAYSELHNIPDVNRTADWHLVEGDIYRKQGDGPAALEAWRASIQQDPHSPEPYKRMSEYHTLRGDSELAIGEMHDALEILPNDMALHGQLAELALRQDKLDVAESEYRIILDGNPDDPQALLGLLRVGFRKARKDGQYPPGWQKLMDQVQNVVTEQSVKGQVLKEGTKNLQENIELSEAEKANAQNHFHDGRQHFATVINNHKGDAFDLLTLGEQAFNDGDLSSAQLAFTYAKEIPEVTSRAEAGLSKISSQRSEATRQTKLGDAMEKVPEVAIDHYKQALTADPQCSSAYFGLFRMTEKTDAEKAKSYANAFLETAEDNNPNRKDVEAYLAKEGKLVPKKTESKRFFGKKK